MKPLRIGKGNNCPKCNKPMQRRSHKPEWRPKKMQPYYFAYWDICKKCKRVQHYEEAKTACVFEPEATLL